MNRMYRIVALALAAVLCLSLAACGAKAPASSSGSVSEAGSSSVSAPADSVPGSGSVSAPSGETGAAESEGLRYAAAIRDVRTAEENEYMKLVATLADGTTTLDADLPEAADEAGSNAIQMMMETMGLSAEMLDSYAFSMSMMNIKAYAVGVFKPAEGQAEAVQAALEEYVSLQRKSFETYLADQYEVAKNALIEMLPGGEIALVMCEGSADVMENLQAALK